MSDEEEVYSEEEEEEEEEKEEEEAPAPRSDEEVEKDDKKSDAEKDASDDDDDEGEENDIKAKDEKEEDEPAPPPQREEKPAPNRSAPAPSRGPSEAEIAMQKRRQKLQEAGIEEQYLELLDAARKEREAIEDEITVLRQRTKRKLGNIGDLDDEAQLLLSDNAKERAVMESEINEMRQRSEKRKREREQEEKRAAERRAEEEARRKAEEEERRRKKEEEDVKKKAARAEKMEQFEKLKNPTKPNFVISKRADGTMGVEDEEEVGEKKSKEQLEAEKKAILSQRMPAKPDVSSMDDSKLQEKAKELFRELCRLEGEKYDLEKRFKEQQRDMMELAERARSINKVGKGGLKRQQLDDEDPMAQKFAGIPAKIQMYSKYERTKDKRDFGEKHVVFHGPTWCFAPDRIKPEKNVKFNPDTGLPEYEDIEGAGGSEEVAAEGEE